MLTDAANMGRIGVEGADMAVTAVAEKADKTDVGEKDAAEEKVDGVVEYPVV